MKTINYFSGSLLALLFYALFAACNNDLQTLKRKQYFNKFRCSNR